MQFRICSPAGLPDLICVYAGDGHLYLAREQYALDRPIKTQSFEFEASESQERVSTG